MISHHFRDGPMNRFLTLPLSATILAVLLAAPLRAQDAAELQLRVDRLESLVRQQNGLIEQVQNQNRRLEEQVRRMQSDVDFRLKEIEGARSAPGSGRPPAAPANPPRQQRGDAFNPDAQPGAGGVQALGSPQSASAPRQPRPVGPVAQPGQIIQGEDNALGRDPRQPTDLASAGRAAPVAPAAGPETPASLRTRGREQLQRGEYEAAETTFRDMIKARPGDRLLPDAMMGLGDSLFQRQRWREAAEQYVDITARFAKATVAPEAELKLGISLRSLGAAKEACDVLTNHGQKYPKAAPAIRQGVQRELQRGKCAA
jgi:TolA-binding protein